MNGEIKFRRINGRIVPIRSKKEVQKNRKHGGMILASGLAVSALGGYGAGKTLKRADRHSQMSFDFMNEKKGSRLPRGTNSIFEGMKKARKGLITAKKLSKFSRIAGTGLAFVGINKLIRNQKDSEVKDAAKIFGAAVVSDVGMTALHRGARVTTRTWKSGKSLKHLLKATFKSRF